MSEVDVSESVSFYPRERKNNPPLWYVRAKVSGKWKLLNTSATTEKAARAWWRQQVLSGRLQAEQKPIPTCDEWADGFYGLGGRYDLAKRARGHNLSQTYLENMGRHYKKYLSPVFGSRKIDAIPALDLENLLLELFNERSLSGSSRQNVQAAKME